MSIRITSLQNPKVKRLVALQQKAKARKEAEQFVVEGRREVERAMKAGWQLQELWSIEGRIPFAKLDTEVHVVECSLPVFKKVAYREADAEVVAVFKTRYFELSELKAIKEPLVVVLEHLEKPGNLGAIIRTCNGLGVDAVLVCDAATEIFNPNVIRNSLGGFFDIPIMQCSSQAAIRYFKENDFSLFVTHLEAATSFTEVSYRGSAALILGSEAKGVSKEWVENTTQNIIIPMTGIVDSLNVSVAAGIVISEAIKQRIRV